MVEVLNLDSTDFSEAQIKLKKSLTGASAAKSRIIVLTPSLARKIQD